MRTIWKYPIEIKDAPNTLTMPIGAEILSVGVQLGEPVLWALVETENPVKKRHFKVYGTGHPMDEGGSYIGTIQMSPFVWHLFEV